MCDNTYSDYGSGCSSSSLSSWLWPEKLSSSLPAHRPNSAHLDHKHSSYLDSVMGKSSQEEVRREFQMNGLDSPYDPEEQWTRRPGSLRGMGPAAQYLRQKSWPEPERTPLPVAVAPEAGTGGARRSRPLSLHDPRWLPHAPQDFSASTPIIQDAPPAPFRAGILPSEVYCKPEITPDQERVLASISDVTLYAMLRQLEEDRRGKQQVECRFCKNNGERSSFYRSHALKDPTGRVTCPVLRAFTCHQCGATGDRAHTIKYCPISTNEDRIKSAGIMRSVRMSSGRRRRHSLAPSVSDIADYVVFGEPSPSVVNDNNAFNYGPLDPLWAALEQKLLL